jgi:hypothetical protein
MLGLAIWKKVGVSVFWIANAVALAVVVSFLVGSLCNMNNIVTSIAAFFVAVMGLYWCVRCVEQADKYLFTSTLGNQIKTKE